ncbi:class I SAM-dependent methyltransferase [Paenibacillus dauci]|uniref:class I SAM-dependent methyltransferase n=1 Tax=Paenibacillus dauci TaxID=1567106 RepID=UPI0006192F47|nr:class I SAM-dependent methyltransferase [Paenibacillus dauci]
MNCCVCNSITSHLEDYKAAPHDLMSGYNATSLSLHDIEIYHCMFCGHTQIPMYVSDEYYDNYSMGSFWGASFKNVRVKQVEQLASITSANNLLDIGCGVGHYLELAQEHFKNVYGVEPSKTAVEVARQKGFTVVNDYFHGELKFNLSFDAITIIEVLEHLENPVELFKQAATLLSDNGVLLVEVPNGQRIYENKLYNNLCTDHIQYFSILSLSIMAYQAGLTIICVQEAENPNLLELYARKISNPKAKTFSEKRENELNTLLAKLGSHSKIAGWGAGAESACFLTMLENKVDIECIFDSDQAKHNHHIMNIPIINPTKEIVKSYDHIILFANSHKLQIKKQLKQLGYTGKLITFEE